MIPGAGFAFGANQNAQSISSTSSLAPLAGIIDNASSPADIVQSKLNGSCVLSSFI